MMKIIILGSQLPAATQTRLKTSGPIHAELWQDSHLKIEDFRCGPFIWATRMSQAMQTQKLLAQDSQMLRSFYRCSVAASFSVPELFSYKGIAGPAASHCRSWWILKEAPFTLKPDISDKWFWVPPYSETFQHNRSCCTKTGTAALRVSAYKHLRTQLELASPSPTNSWKKIFSGN